MAFAFSFWKTGKIIASGGGGGGVAPSFVQAINAANDSTANTLPTTGVTTTTGNTFIVTVAWDSISLTASITDTYGNTWTPTAGGQINDTRNGQAMQSFICSNATGGASHVFTFHPSVATDGMRIVVTEIHGAKSSAAEDQHVENITMAGTTLTFGTVTPSNNNQLIYAVAMVDGGTGTDTFTAGSGFTMAANGTSSVGAFAMGVEYMQQTTAGAQSCTLTTTTSGQAFGQVITIKSS